jgi:hypothetical protein
MRTFARFRLSFLGLGGIGHAAAQETSLPPGTSFKPGADAADRWLVLEAGVASVTPYSDQSQWVTKPSPSELGAPDGVPILLSSSELFALPSMTRVEVRNGATSLARVLVLSLSPPAATPAWTDSPAPQERTVSEQDTSAQPKSTTGTPTALDCGTITSLASSVQTTLPRDQAVIVVGHAMLAAWAVLADVETVGPQMIVVNAGTLGLVADGNLAMIHKGEDRYGAAGILSAGSSALLTLNLVASLSSLSDQPVDLMMIAIVPAGAMSGPSV